MNVFVVEGDAMDYDDSSWLENVYSSLDKIPQEFKTNSLPYLGRSQTYTITEIEPDVGQVCRWFWRNGEWEPMAFHVRAPVEVFRAVRDKIRKEYKDDPDLLRLANSISIYVYRMKKGTEAVVVIDTRGEFLKWAELAGEVQTGRRSQ